MANRPLRSGAEGAAQSAVCPLVRCHSPRRRYSRWASPGNLRLNHNGSASALNVRGITPVRFMSRAYDPGLISIRLYQNERASPAPSGASPTLFECPNSFHLVPAKVKSLGSPPSGKTCGTVADYRLSQQAALFPASPCGIVAWHGRRHITAKG